MKRCAGLVLLPDSVFNEFGYQIIDCLGFARRARVSRESVQVDAAREGEIPSSRPCPSQIDLLNFLVRAEGHPKLTLSSS